ncbi:MAG: hypothetical protein CMP12_04405 [Zunongwangia sp.]|uniref:Transmembrane protein n=4 Tax=Zunongwangia profunda TaxID=398743 RepID=D5BHV0_ZUNPS|nr:tetratricopeptide repeat-containing sensor histidine kinase [Zunongwangia profunda]ADF51338.1 putative transmembrane protein [Zunongwangia profunda SM-A87]MAO35146.1 hypothetical protein [Zunongwangia sp.]MAS69661.1 hypothetical protein [Zunongwangia sp.]HCV80716.1 hypothetical protein [Zunongwangia profunda]|tara:strand:+ start:1141 stop:3138 length:1998 start_codon:yes stop_codon:yes gene_type:complete
MKNGLILFLLCLILFACQENNNIDEEKERVETLKNKIVSLSDSELIDQEWDKIIVDSIRVNLASELSKYFRKAGDSSNFYKWNARFYKASSLQGNTIHTGDAYWDKASFNSARSKLDSAYYYFGKGLEIYNELDIESRKASMLYGLASVQLELKNYLGSEVLAIENLKLAESLEDLSRIYKCYNLLGIIHNNLKNYDTALDYHSKALDVARELSNDYFIILSKNNIAYLNQEHGYYDQAITVSEEALAYDDSIRFKYPAAYAKLIDNLAYSQLKAERGSSTILKTMKESRRIRDSLNDIPGLAVGDIHIAEYHIAHGNLRKAKAILLELIETTKENENAADLMTALELLGKVDSANSQKYLEERIAISDSLIDIERKTQNKFARTQYETDKVIATNQELTSEKKIIILTSSVGFLVISLIYFIVVQKTRVKKLRLEQAQDKSNEEIYKLLIAQQNSLEEGRRLEKNRMSKELHDSVLGKLFGIRFLLSSLNSMSGQETEQQREKYLKDLEETEEEIRQISHDLQDKNEVFQSSFYQIIRNFLEDQNNIYSFRIDLHMETGTVDLNVIPISHKINIFRILQESIFNIQKYAKATKACVRITVDREEKNIFLEVEDNGLGFNVKVTKKGIGLSNIEDRTKEMGGSFKIISHPSRTLIKVIIPIQNEI